jgi:hypothetical protein
MLRIFLCPSLIAISGNSSIFNELACAILRDFRRYLIQKKIKPEKKRVTVVYSTNWGKRMSTAAR